MKGETLLRTPAPLLGSRLLRNRDGTSFVDVTGSSGTGEFHKEHGVAFADLDHDGDEEIVFEVGGATPADAHALRLFENPGHGRDWITLKLVGVKTNRAAIGARITVRVDGAGGRRSIHRTVTAAARSGRRRCSSTSASAPMPATSRSRSGGPPATRGSASRRSARTSTSRSRSSPRAIGPCSGRRCRCERRTMTLPPHAHADCRLRPPVLERLRRRSRTGGGL